MGLQASKVQIVHGWAHKNSTFIMQVRHRSQLRMSKGASCVQLLYSPQTHLEFGQTGLLPERRDGSCSPQRARETLFGAFYLTLLLNCPPAYVSSSVDPAQPRLQPHSSRISQDSSATRARCDTLPRPADSEHWDLQSDRALPDADDA